MSDAKLSDIGERKAIGKIARIFGARGATAKRFGATAIGIGDDCAAIEMGKNYLLVTTDVINSKTHIPQQAAPWQIGWFSVAINLSDIAAKGGKPLGLVMAIGLPRDTDLSFLEEMARGMNGCARKYGTAIIGGDTKENPTLTIAGTALGLVPKSRFMPRFGAKEGDVIAVTGTLGAAAAGYYSLRKNMALRRAEKRFLEPQPRIFEGIALSKTGAATSCMDISDGLASSLYQMTKLGCEIDISRLPVAPEALAVERKVGFSRKTPSCAPKEREKVRKTGCSALEQALYFGGDYELVCTLKPELADRAVRAVERAGGRLTTIGKIKGKRKLLVGADGKKRALENKGYEHFLG